MTCHEAADAELARTNLHDLVAVDALTCGTISYLIVGLFRMACSVACLSTIRCLLQRPCMQLRNVHGLTQAFQYCVCLAWLTAPGPHLLASAVLRHRIAAHLHLPLCGVGVRCCYTGQACAGSCNAIGHHVHSRGHGPRQRNAWQRLLCEVGWHVSAEQIVNTTAGPDRADLVAISPVGLSYALDVHVTATLHSADPC